MMMDITIFLIGLFFLIYFSYEDIKKQEISNFSIIIFSIFTLIILTQFPDKLIRILFVFLWFLLSLFFWMNGSFGGADAKLMPLISVYVSFLIPNIISGQFMFIIGLGILSLIYAILGKLIIKKDKIPFIPIITISYSLIGLIGYIMRGS